MHQRVGSEVLEAFAAGDDQALTEIYRRYSGPMFTVAMRTLRRSDLAAEAVQQSFVKAWRAAASYSPQTDLGSWLFAITHRTAIDLWRSERRRGLREGIADTLEAAIPGPSMESAWEAWQVRQAIDELPTDERDVIFLAYVADMTHTEIAAHLAIPLGTVKSRSHRAHRRLTGRLAHLTHDPEKEG